MSRNDAQAMLHHLQYYVSMARARTTRRLLLLQMDNGSEYDNGLMEAFCAQHLIHRQFSAPHRQGMNGKAERMWRTLEEGVMALLDQAGASPPHWALAMSTMVHVRNVLPRKSSRRSPFQRFTRKSPPPLSSLHPFGCAAYALIDRSQQRKLGGKSDPCIFLGYSSRTAGSYVVRRVASGVIVVRRDVKFRDNVFPMKIANRIGRPLSLPLPDEHPDVMDEDRRQVCLDYSIGVSPEEVLSEEELSEEEPSEEEAAPMEADLPQFWARRSSLEKPDQADDCNDQDPVVWAPRVQPIEEEKNFTDIDDSNILPDDAVRAAAMSVLAADDVIFCSGGRRLAPTGVSVVAMVAAAKVCLHDHEPDPATIKQAMRSSNWPSWKQAIEEEMRALNKNSTYELVPRQPGMKCIGTKLVLKTKFAKGKLTR